MREAKYFFETVCHKCGCINEAKFVFSTNGAVKQVCNDCGFYVKFFNKALIPTHYAIKEKIWYIVEGDLEIIKEAKKDVEFIEELKGLSKQLMYWKLYLEILNHVKNLPNKL